MSIDKPEQPPYLAEACADPGEVLAVSVLRFIAAAAMTGDAACWDAAHDCAEGIIGPSEGPRLVATMAGVMRALQRERHGAWRFLPASCCRVTADERLLIDAISEARRGSPEGFERRVRALAGHASAPRLHATLLQAACTVGQLGLKELARDAPGPLFAKGLVH